MAEETMNDWASTFVRIVSFIGLVSVFFGVE